MSNIRPDEVSSIIRDQLSNFKSESELEEVGTILQVGDGVARIYGLSNAKAGELLEFDGGVKGLVLNLEEDKDFGLFKQGLYLDGFLFDSTKSLALYG